MRGVCDLSRGKKLSVTADIRYKYGRFLSHGRSFAGEYR